MAAWVAGAKEGFFAVIDKIGDWTIKPIWQNIKLLYKNFKKKRLPDPITGRKRSRVSSFFASGLKCLACFFGGLLGAAAGAVVGSLLGTVIFPGAGTVVGGASGAALGIKLVVGFIVGARIGHAGGSGISTCYYCCKTGRTYELPNLDSALVQHIIEGSTPSIPLNEFDAIWIIRSLTICQNESGISQQEKDGISRALDLFERGSIDRALGINYGGPIIREAYRQSRVFQTGASPRSIGNEDLEACYKDYQRNRRLRLSAIIRPQRQTMDSTCLNRLASQAASEKKHRVEAMVIDTEGSMSLEETGLRLRSPTPSLLRAFEAHSENGIELTEIGGGYSRFSRSGSINSAGSPISSTSTDSLTKKLV